MEFMEAVLKRRTYRGHFIDKPISQKDLDIIIEAARWAPSPFNTQPWEILIVTQQESKDKLADLVLKSMVSQMGDARFLQYTSECMSLTREEWIKRGEGVLIDDHVDVPGFIKDRKKLRPLMKNAKNLAFLGKLGLGKMGAAKFVEFIRRAPLIIIILVDKKKKFPGSNVLAWKFLGMGAIMENVLLAATALNIGTHIINTCLETEEDISILREILSIPASYEPVCLIRAGYFRDPPDYSVRLKPERFVHYERFGDSKGK
jgi:nitroreductase